MPITKNAKNEKVKPEEPAKATKRANEEEKTYCYIGPNLPDGALKKNSIIIGTKSAIKDRYKDEIEKYPQIERLMVNVEQLADAKAKVEEPGNILHKYYNDVNSTVIAKVETEE